MAGATAVGQLDTPGGRGITSSRADASSRLTRVQADLLAQFNAVTNLSRAIEGYSGLPTAEQRKQLDWAFEDAGKGDRRAEPHPADRHCTVPPDGTDQADQGSMNRFVLTVICALLVGACDSTTSPTPPPPTEDPPQITCPATRRFS